MQCDRIDTYFLYVQFQFVCFSSCKLFEHHKENNNSSFLVVYFISRLYDWNGNVYEELILNWCGINYYLCIRKNFCSTNLHVYIWIGGLNCLISGGKKSSLSNIKGTALYWMQYWSTFWPTVKKINNVFWILILKVGFLKI